jgi:hypothetical protein
MIREGGKDYHAIAKFYAREYKGSQGLRQTIRQSGDNKSKTKEKKNTFFVVCSHIILHTEQ